MSWMAHRTAHLARRAWRAVLRGFVRYQIHSCESYLEACRADGLIHSPFLDGDGPQGKSKKDGKPHKGFPGTIFIRCSSGKDYQPKVYNRQKIDVMTPDGCPSGSQVYGVVSAYTWEHKKTNRRGVTFGISMVQVVKIATGDEVLGGGAGGDPDKYFDAIADEGAAPKETKSGAGAGSLFG